MRLVLLALFVSLACAGCYSPRAYYDGSLRMACDVYCACAGDLEPDPHFRGPAQRCPR